MMLKFVWHRDYIVKTNIFPHENSKTYMCIYRKRKELISYYSPRLKRKWSVANTMDDDMCDYCVEMCALGLINIVSAFF